MELGTTENIGRVCDKAKEGRFDLQTSFFPILLLWPTDLTLSFLVAKAKRGAF